MISLSLFNVAGRLLPRESWLEYFVLCTLALAAGAAASFTMAPYHWWGMLFPALSGLYLLLCARRNFAAGLGLGWCYGFTFFAFSLSWIGNALLVEGNDYAWAWPLAVCALPAALAFFPALACAISARWYSSGSWQSYLGFCAILALSEWLRGHLFTGFPWNLAGYAWGNHLPILQILFLSDVYALTLLTFLLAGLPGLWLALPKKDGIAPTALSLIILGAFGFGYVWGIERLQAHPQEMREGLSIKIVQPNIPQSEKWDAQKIARHFQVLVDSSFSTGMENEEETTLIVWPETALHYLFLDDSGSRSYITSMLKSYAGRAFLVSGALIRDAKEKTYSNSVIIIDSNGEIVERYNKFHLVPFGEYIPFQNWIPLETVTQFSGFIRGDGPETKSLDIGTEKLTISPLVCYEILFPHRVIDPQNRPDVIINVTNDGWYGFSAGPHQHFLKARLRAIEEGLPVIRAANTGISGLIDPYGRVLTQSELFIQSLYTVNLPQRVEVSGFFRYAKGWVFYILLLFLMGLANFPRKNNNLEL